jgi:hypothetical protein
MAPPAGEPPEELKRRFALGSEPALASPDRQDRRMTTETTDSVR